MIIPSIWVRWLMWLLTVQVLVMRSSWWRGGGFGGVRPWWWVIGLAAELVDEVGEWVGKSVDEFGE